MGRQSLKHVGGLKAKAHFREQRLSCRSRFVECALNFSEVAKPACQSQSLVAIPGRRGGERQDGRSAGRKLDNRTEAEDRVQHRAHGSRKGGSILESGRIRGGAAPSEEPRPVSLELDAPVGGRK